MKPIPAEQLVEGLSADLQDLLVREAFVRARRAQVQAELESRRAAEAGRVGTRPAFLMFRKDAKGEFEAAGERLRAEIAGLEQALSNCDLILRKCERIVAGEVEAYLEAQSAEFRRAREARDVVPEWREAVGLYRSCLKRFIMALGIARNQMASGYDRKTGKFAQGTLEAFAGAVAAARALEGEATIPNQLARRQREFLGLDVVAEALAGESAGLPYLAGGSLVKQVSELATSTLEVAAARLGALIEHAEQLHHEGLEALIERATRDEAAQQAARAAQVAAPLGEIRAMADGAVEEARMAEVLAAMEARFVTLTG